MSDSPLKWRSGLRRVWHDRRWIIVAALALLLAASVTWALASTRQSRQETRGQARPDDAGTATGSESMAGMDMGTMSMSGGGPGDGSAHLSASQIHEFGITFDTAKVRPLTAQVRTVGTVAVDETRLSQVAARFSGFVERLYVEATGEPVHRGQPLMDIYSPELLAAEQELLVAGNLERSLAGSTVPGMPTTTPDLVTAAKRRLQLWGISDAQIAEILRTGKPRRALTLYAPTTGIVLRKDVVQGQAIQVGQTLYTIANLSAVWIEAQLREQDAGSVAVGSAATAQLAALPGRPASGRVAYVYPTLEAQSRTITARIVIPNPGVLLKPGMYATVTISTPTQSALTVPTSAVVNTGERSIVFVDMGKGELMPHDVVIGRVAGNYAEVLSGLESGQRVVTSAQFLLDSESNIADVMKSMIGQMGATDSPHDDRMGKASGPAKGGSMKDEPEAEMPGMTMPPERR